MNSVSACIGSHLNKNVCICFRLHKLFECVRAFFCNRCAPIITLSLIPQITRFYRIRQGIDEWKKNEQARKKRDEKHIFRLLNTYSVQSLCVSVLFFPFRLSVFRAVYEWSGHCLQIRWLKSTGMPLRDCVHNMLSHVECILVHLGLCLSLVNQQQQNQRLTIANRMYNTFIVIQFHYRFARTIATNQLKNTDQSSCFECFIGFGTSLSNHFRWNVFEHFFAHTRKIWNMDVHFWNTR